MCTTISCVIYPPLTTDTDTSDYYIWCSRSAEWSNTDTAINLNRTSMYQCKFSRVSSWCLCIRLCVVVYVVCFVCVCVCVVCVCVVCVCMLCTYAHTSTHTNTQYHTHIHTQTQTQTQTQTHVGLGYSDAACTYAVPIQTDWRCAPCTIRHHSSLTTHHMTYLTRTTLHNTSTHYLHTHTHAHKPRTR